MFIGRTDVETETPILWPPDAKSWLIGKDPDAGKDWRREKGMTEDEMVGWHHRRDGHEFELTLGVVDGQGSLVCCSPWGSRESDMTEQLNWTELAFLERDGALLWALVPPGGREGKMQAVESRRSEDCPVSWSLHWHCEKRCPQRVRAAHTVMKHPACRRRCKRLRLDPWVGKIPWRRKSPPAPVFLPGPFPGWEAWPAMVQGCNESDTPEQLSTQSLVLNSFAHF